MLQIFINFTMLTYDWFQSSFIHSDGKTGLFTENPAILWVHYVFAFPFENYNFEKGFLNSQSGQNVGQIINQTGLDMQ